MVHAHGRQELGTRDERLGEPREEGRGRDVKVCLVVCQIEE